VLYSFDLLNYHSLHFTTSVTCHPCRGVETTVDNRQCCFPCRNHTVAGPNQVWRFIKVFLWSNRKQSVEDWTISERMGLHATNRSFLAVPGAKELTWKVCKKFVMKRNLRLQDNLRYYVITVMTILWYYTLPWILSRVLFCGYEVNGNSFLEKVILKLSVLVVYNFLTCGTTHH
jgi:hypothetical protein